MIDLRLGRWQDALADVGEVDAIITDPPYGARTHEGNQLLADKFAATTSAGTRDLDYAHLTPDDVRAFVDAWAPRCRGWFVAMTSDDLAPHWRKAYEDAGRYAFAPVVVVAHRFRMAGDGPASSAVYAMVSRPRCKKFCGWGSLPGWYEAGIDRSGVIGGKPIDLMRVIVRDYSRPGDLVCDPCAGGATTLIAAAMENRRAVGAEMDPETFAKAKRRIARGYTPDLFGGAA